SRVRVSSPPGASLRALADFFCSPKTMERVVKPVISDMQKEFCKALSEKKRLKAAWIRIRGYWSFWKALGLHAVVKNLVEIWKISGMRWVWQDSASNKFLAPFQENGVSPGNDFRPDSLFPFHRRLTAYSSALGSDFSA